MSAENPVGSWIDRGHLRDGIIYCLDPACAVCRVAIDIREDFDAADRALLAEADADLDRQYEKCLGGCVPGRHLILSRERESGLCYVCMARRDG